MQYLTRNTVSGISTEVAIVQESLWKANLAPEPPPPLCLTAVHHLTTNKLTHVPLPVITSPGKPALLKGKLIDSCFNILSNYPFISCSKELKSPFVPYLNNYPIFVPKKKKKNYAFQFSHDIIDLFHFCLKSPKKIVNGVVVCYAIAQFCPQIKSSHDIHAT